MNSIGLFWSIFFLIYRDNKSFMGCQILDFLNNQNKFYEFVSMFSVGRWFALYIAGILWQECCMFDCAWMAYIPEKCHILPCNQKNQATSSKRDGDGVWYVFICINYLSKSELSLALNWLGFCGGTCWPGFKPSTWYEI